MAFKKSFIAKGITCTDGYWKVEQTNLNHIYKTGQVIFKGYYDKNARMADPYGNVLEQKSYEITPEQYESYFAKEADPRAASYDVAKETLEGTAEDGSEGGERKSFFDGATDA